VLHKALRWNVLDDDHWRPDGVEVSIAALIELVEGAAPDLAAHMERTRRLARRLALELGLSGPLLDLVVRTARVHDVGKLAVPDLPHAHPVAGQKILQRKPALLTLGPLVRATHEHWDGTGYPDGLKGSTIPVAARIVSVCAAFDSMTNPLDEEPPMPVEAALETLDRDSGTRFDPAIVEPFRDVITSLRRP
jgi:HD-GYP domain-containing protein (c-di-GMP phosphodiesterase class II)